MGKTPTGVSWNLRRSPSTRAKFISRFLFIQVDSVQLKPWNFHIARNFEVTFKVNSRYSLDKKSVGSPNGTDASIV